MKSNTEIEILKQLKSRFKPTINWNKYQSNVTPQNLKHYLDQIIDPGFQGVNRAFVLPFEDDIVTRGRTGNFLSKVEIKQ